MPHGGTSEQPEPLGTEQPNSFVSAPTTAL